MSPVQVYYEIFYSIGRIIQQFHFRSVVRRVVARVKRRGTKFSMQKSSIFIDHISRSSFRKKHFLAMQKMVIMTFCL